MPRPSLSRLPKLGLCLIALSAAAGLRSAPAGAEKVLFAFDDRWLPFQYGLRMQLAGFQENAAVPFNRVVSAGPAGAPDSHGCYYYGTVRQVGGELWMWYYGIGDHDPEPATAYLRLCLAKSADGMHWQKPDLGLVEYAGSKHNNLISLDGREFIGQGCTVVHEPDDPNPDKRFKMVFEVTRYERKLAVAYSPDGIRWTDDPQNPRGPGIEPSGIMKWHGAYYVTGHTRGHWLPSGYFARALDTFVSYDFENWFPLPAMGFRRDPLPPRPVTQTGSNDGEQVHMGAGLWDRGNVILGFYGQWHGPHIDDRALVAMDLGLVVSHDALHYYEPIPDFRMVAAKENFHQWPRKAINEFPAVMQGQGFANIGDRTLFWYCLWNDPENGVRVATWPRDRLGFLQPFTPDGPAVVSAPISLDGGAAEISVNADGLSARSALKVSVLDEQFRPLAGYGAADCTGPTRPGLREPAAWGARKRVESARPIRLRIDFGGDRPEDLRLYAVYVAPSP